MYVYVLFTVYTTACFQVLLIPQTTHFVSIEA